MNKKNHAGDAVANPQLNGANNLANSAINARNVAFSSNGITNLSKTKTALFGSKNGLWKGRYTNTLYETPECQKVLYNGFLKDFFKRHQMYQ
jgi:hypothetical protein